MGLLSDFKKFAMKGNIVDLAVAVIIGAAFKEIIGSFVNDVLMPPIGVAIGGVDFKDLVMIIEEGATKEDNVVIRYGKFIQTVIDFLIIAFSVFMVVKVYQKTQKKEEEKPAAPPEPTKEEVLLGEIRDLLKK